ncbi:ABC-type nitrate/sulfonate/bicarbonate transport system, permease component [Quadrisphaera granulorum]|uniref:ABC-type nitrate/sulfonate/bicarbonate transport system permease component n=1 Tax=Quadrisphaera granulorum TaxID=317664 RepID=A0A315ZZZ9_9ACTN|nr:ABC transporter permease [Quadrisphaera granulorum]PWJ51161.1 ABC-type nitrate/sulfonate/bicarbonate transport system permease component [Quadrisphaera granulorum]SZE97811.1 ABC-type nitrate/sulfonate/bicarbonate transport system, permease component [Quadrisphaera granulorum]
MQPSALAPAAVARASTPAPSSSSSPRRGRGRRRAARRAGLGALGIVLFVGVWQLVPTAGLLDGRYFPPPTAVLPRLATDLGDLEFWRNIRRTMSTWAIGLVVATSAATVLATVIGLVPFLRSATHTTVEFLRPIPSVALIPLCVLVFGIQPQAALVIIVFASFWQVFVQVLYGVADVDSVARDTARSFGLGRWSRVRHLVLPTALPYLMTGVRLAAAVALILAITAEMFIGNPGLGRALIFAQSAGDYPQVYALVIATGLLGLGVNLVFRLVERRALSWHQSVRGEEVP